MGWRRILRYRRLLLLTSLLGALVLLPIANTTWRSMRQKDRVPTATCAPADPRRDHFLPPVVEAPLPPESDLPPEQAPPTWIGFTKPLAIDFTRVLLRGSEDQLRQYVAPDTKFDLAALRQELGVSCPADTFTVHRTHVSDDEVIMEPTIYYEDYAVTIRVVLRLYPDQWWVTVVAPT